MKCLPNPITSIHSAPVVTRTCHYQVPSDESSHDKPSPRSKQRLERQRDDLSLETNAQQSLETTSQPKHVDKWDHKDHNILGNDTGISSQHALRSKLKDLIRMQSKPKKQGVEVSKRCQTDSKLATIATTPRSSQGSQSEPSKQKNSSLRSFQQSKKVTQRLSIRSKSVGDKHLRLSSKSGSSKLDRENDIVNESRHSKTAYQRLYELSAKKREEGKERRAQITERRRSRKHTISFPQAQECAKVSSAAIQS